jgi:C1A family cysteine protease
MPLDFTTILPSLSRGKWTAQANHITQAEPNTRKRRLGFVPGPNDHSLKAREDLSRAHLQGSMMALQAAPPLYPQTYDWRAAPGGDYVTSVKDQGQCGSCCAFGSIAAIEATYQVANNTPNSGIDLSEAHLFFCYGNAAGRICGCNQEQNSGWWPYSALDSTKNGIASELSYPYPNETVCGDHDCSGLNPAWQATAMKITGWHSLNSLNDMKTWISTRGPLVTTMSVYEDFYAYATGVYRYVNGALEGGHCICVVGYDEGQQCWICKNSWDATWGQAGFFLIEYGQCGIDATMYAVEGVVQF